MPRSPLALLTSFIAAAALAFPYGVAERGGISAFPQKIRSFHTREEFERLTGGSVEIHRDLRCRTAGGDVLVGSEAGVVLQRRDGAVQPFPPDRLLPVPVVGVIAEEASGIHWFGTPRGAIRVSSRSRPSQIEYFSGRRWLMEDGVTGIGIEKSGEGGRVAAVWIETRGGYSRIEFRMMTLLEKARHFQERVRARHVRHGLTASSRLMVAGEPGSSRTVSSDNDGLWTAMYVAGECFRYRVTGEEPAREAARQGIEALMRLEAITGIPGFPARSIIRIGAEERPADGEWHPTADGEWMWKGDTSSDEIVGHYFAYAVYYDLVANESEQRRIRAVVERITSHIVDNGYHLLDVDGRPTTWGWWAPEEIWRDPDETGLRALHLLSHLKAAHHITGNSKFLSRYRDLVANHRYAHLTRNQKIQVPGHINHSDDELAFLSFYPLLRYERDPDLRRTYADSLRRSWEIERPERNPLWNFIYAVGSGSEEFDRAESIRTLREIPWDLVSWTVSNSHRVDVALDPAADRFRRPQSLSVLPYEELPVMKWNGNPYVLDGGNGGMSEDDGAFFLLPYWMGRYHELIGE